MELEEYKAKSRDIFEALRGLPKGWNDRERPMMIDFLT